MEQGISGTWNMVYLEHVIRYIWNIEHGISGTCNKVYLEHGTRYIWNMEHGVSGTCSMVYLESGSRTNCNFYPFYKFLNLKGLLSLTKQKFTPLNFISIETRRNNICIL